ncbi:MAG: DNRLRE domain-containing protein [Melioribacteraceae bacterium]|nr:DNRLRE domain-containing protein [Melioribacteraceae bacterium]
MSKLFRFFLTTFPLIFIFAGCNQEPSSIGADIIGGTDKILFKEFDSNSENVFQRSNNFKKPLRLGSADMILLGKNDNIESNILLTFEIFLNDSLKKYFTDNRLILKSAWFVMRSYYFLGDEKSPLNFSVHKIKSGWSPVGFDNDSLKVLQYDNQNLISNLKEKDSVFTADLNPSVINDWLRTRYSNSGESNYGLLFKPAVNAKRFVGFPAYIISYETDQPKLYVELQRPGNLLDTIIATPYSDIHTFVGELNQEPNYIYNQGGLAINSNLYFNLTSFPKDVIINKATLELTSDTLKSIDGIPSSDSINVQMIADSISNALTSDSLYSAILVKNKNIYSGDITWMVQKWISESANHGVRLSLYDEYTSAARLSFYGSKESNKLLRPRLKIIYTQKR